MDDLCTSGRLNESAPPLEPTRCGLQEPAVLLAVVAIVVIALSVQARELTDYVGIPMILEEILAVPGPYACTVRHPKVIKCARHVAGPIRELTSLSNTTMAPLNPPSPGPKPRATGLNRRPPAVTRRVPTAMCRPVPGCGPVGDCTARQARAHVPRTLATLRVHAPPPLPSDGALPMHRGNKCRHHTPS